jgi:hypothetical protein
MLEGAAVISIAILYICTGKYDVFWEDFYRSCEKFFLNEHRKHYFVFTDSSSIYAEDNPVVNKIYQENLGWPGNTLFRYKVFKSIEENLLQFEYIFFFNANVEFLESINAEILPRDEGLVVVQHPGFFNKTNLDFTYERNPKSLAYIPFGEGNVYICGGVNGGKAKEFINLINSINENTDKDYEVGIIAKWHDESHINRYILSHQYKLLNPSYAYPDGWNIPFEKKVLIRDKNKYGGHAFLRDVQMTWYQKICDKVRCVYQRLLAKG